jgi:hypothetical protein
MFNCCEIFFFFLEDVRYIQLGQSRQFAAQMPGSPETHKIVELLQNS